ncbi:MAG: purine-nucleoside phosphorylase [Elusimicrobia bacterium]|nr:purine-nucleoside phosphorylase [Elusimicrobiota bacterium]
MSKDFVDSVNAAAEWFAKKTGNLKPDVALITGSGLANSMPGLEDAVTIEYKEVPGLPRTTVKGHKGEFVFGKFGGKKLAIMRGRFHYYEGRPMNFIAFPIRVLQRLGAGTLVLTSAVGSLKNEIEPGHIVILKDHINLMGSNPLIGNYDDAFGEMFPDMNEPYDHELRNNALKICRKLNLPSVEGVYVAVSGPSYETPAEVKAYKMLGGDVVGMSMVPEVIAARQLKMKILGICWISNFASGISKKALSHAEVLELGENMSKNIKKLIEELLK